jgi:hypothetical protein
MRNASLIAAPFAGQFERTATGYLYRRGGRGPALPLSVEEYERSTTGYGRWLIAIFIGFFAAMIGGSMILAPLFPQAEMIGPIVMTVAIGGILYLCIRRAMYAPARALAGRTPVAPARSGDDVARPVMAKLTYDRIFSTGGSLVVVALFEVHESPPAALVCAGSGVVVIIFGCLRKWRWDAAERRRKAVS